MRDPNELIARLNDESAENRLQAVLTAGQPGDGPAPEAVVAALVERLEDRHPGVVQATLETLTRLVGDGRAAVGPAPLARAVTLAGHKSPRVRAEALGALGVFCPDVEAPDREQRLLSGLADADLEVRRTAAAAAGDLKLDAAREPLAEALSRSEMRFEAAFALASLGDRRAREPLEAALGSRRTRLDALEALRRLADPEARASVRAVADGWLTPWIDKLSALATLFILGDVDAGDRIADRAESRRAEERIYALFLLGQYRIEAGREEVGRIAASKADRDRETAIEALGHYGDPEAIATLAGIATDDDDEREPRTAATRALGRLQGPVTERALATLAEDPDPEIRAAALRSASRPSARSDG